MTKKIFIFLIASSFCLSTKNFAQSRRHGVSTDSTAVIIFNSPSSKKVSSRNKKSSEKNIIKLAPLGYISGSFPIYYERSINDFFSVQIGAGLTSRNYMRGILQSEFTGNSKIDYTPSTLGSDISEDIYNFDYRTAKMGTLFSIQPRFYFDSEGIEGSFLAFSLTTYNYKFEIPGIVGTAGSYKQAGAIKSEHESITDYMVHFGHQTLYDRLTIEWTGELGIRKVKGEKYAASFDNSTNPKLVEGTGNYTQNLFNFNIGFKVGYHF